MGSVIGRSAAATIAVIVIWSFLANRSPDLTYHFAPIIAALSGPWLAQATVGRQHMGATAAATGLSVALVLIAGFVLAATDRLQGPTFWSEDGAIVEVVIFALIGGVIGLVLLGKRSVTAVGLEAPTEI